MSDRDRISEIKARLDAATPGPWPDDSPDDIAYLLAELERLSAPVEPPVLSREFLDSLIDGLRDEEFSLNPSQRDGAGKLRDAILESLSQEDGQ